MYIYKPEIYNLYLRNLVKLKRIYEYAYIDVQINTILYFFRMITNLNTFLMP